MRFTYTSHALEMLIDPTIEREWIERTVLSPDSVEPDAKHRDRIRAFGALPERDGRVLRVVYVAGVNEARIITLFLDRSRRGR